MMRKLAWWVLLKLRLFPHIYFTYSPFKIMEFDRLTSGLAWRGDERVLDIGCGEGNHTLLLGRHCGHVTGLDTEPAFVARARWFARHMPGGVRADFTDLPLAKAGFADGTFDRIFSICVIEHIPDHEAILREALRTLKPGGEMIFSVDTLAAITDRDLVARHQREHHVQHYYRADELHELLVGTGFVDVEVRPLFRSELARELFTQGIREGFNFGRLRTRRLTQRLYAAEAATTESTEGIFLIAVARKPIARAAGDDGDD